MKKQQPFQLLNSSVPAGKTMQLTIEVAKLYTNTPIQIPVIVSHAKERGPTLLLMAGTHGDEVNGVEIIRRMIKSKWHKPTRGTVICLPVFNIFGFLNCSREFPDGRDLNRVFPGSNKGSSASQFAHIFMKDIAPAADVVLDFHTGGAQRYNFPQTRCDFSNLKAKELCTIFSAPFMIHSKVIPKSIRNSLTKLNKPYVLFEGGKSNHIDEFVVQTAINGINRVMFHLNMTERACEEETDRKYEIKESKWVRANRSGMLNLVIENGTIVEKGTILAKIADPFGKVERTVKAPFDGIVFNVNEIPLVNKGDALFNIGKIEN